MGIPVFPGNIRTFTPKQDDTTVVDANDVNYLQDEVTSIETVLGTNPQTSVAGALTSSNTTVAARLAAMERSLATINSNVGAAAVVPVGGITAFAGTVAPSGWHLCDGTAVNRADYPILFETIGSTYGAGNGTTTFALPDLRNRFPLGATAGTAAGVTSAGDTHTHTADGTALTTAQLPNHVHPIQDVNHSHGIADQVHSHAPAATAQMTTAQVDQITDKGSAGTAPHPLTSNQWRAVTTTGDGGGTISVPVNMTPSATGINGTGQSGTGLTQTAGIGSGQTHTHTIEQAGAIKPPSLTVNYIIRLDH